MTHAASPVLDEAYERLPGCGPEWGGNLSNHGPMAAEVLARRGFESVVPGWVDAYVRRLDELPPPREAITDDSWSAALGDIARVTDWTEYFERALAGSEWRDVRRMADLKDDGRADPPKPLPGCLAHYLRLS